MRYAKDTALSDLLIPKIRFEKYGCLRKLCAGFIYM